MIVASCSTHLAALQVLVGPWEAHGLEALEVGDLPSQSGAVRVGDARREGVDVPRCLGQDICVASDVAIASDEGGKENQGKNHGAIHGHCCHHLPQVIEVGHS